MIGVNGWLGIDFIDASVDYSGPSIDGSLTIDPLPLIPVRFGIEIHGVSAESDEN